MDYKIDNLKEKVYKNFVTGVYGQPHIPTYNEVMNKITDLTSLDYEPILKNTRMPSISLSGITGKFSNAIDDIGVLFDSVEEESRDVLDQLTNSLKEQNGVKRELNRIQSAADDIMTGKLGEEYLQYNFTESFNDVGNINQGRSDPIDTDAGVFTIRDNSSNVVNMNHYIGRKITFNIVSSVSPIVDQGFVGDANAENILSSSNPGSVTYRVKTTRPAPLTVVMALQLRADAQPVNINALGISLDSSGTKGYVRLYYQNGYQWLDVPGLNMQKIVGDNVSFSFSAVDATHVKLEFIKDLPDTPTTNEYYVTIYDLAIAKSSTRSTAIVYSKPIVLTSYDTENAVVNNISCVVDADVPPTCKLIVSVAPDIKINGQFVDIYGNAVYPDSTEAADFNPQSPGYVFLSDMMNRMELSGLIPYRGFDFAWQEIQTAAVFGNQVPQIVEFKNSTKKLVGTNTIYNTNASMLYGDRSYTGPWPENVLYTGVYLSGWCNSSNPAWLTVLKDIVASGQLPSGIDLTSAAGSWDLIADGNGHTYWSVKLVPPDPDDLSVGATITGYGIYSGVLTNSSWSGQWLGYGSGIPYNYESGILLYGSYGQAYDGWWRPQVGTLTESGVEAQYSNGGYLIDRLAGTYSPDFYFNGLEFYKIYKFSNLSNVIESSIKLYRYEERPSSNVADAAAYSHEFKWTYKTAFINQTTTLLNQSSTIYLDFNSYFLPFPELQANQEYSVLGVNQVKQTGTNFVLSDSDYVVVPNTVGTISGILLSPLAKNYPYLSPQNVAFDISFNYRVKNQYLSTWVAFAIVAPKVDITVSVTNRDSFDQPGFPIIDSILIEDIDNKTSSTLSDPNTITMKFNRLASNTEGHFKITMFCMSDSVTGFCAKTDPTTYFVPKTNMTISAGGIRFVSKLDPLVVCSLPSLIYDTASNNDRKCALIEDSIGEKYLVVKKPSKENFPGYYFDNSNLAYHFDSSNQIKNKGHYVRQMWLNNSKITFTTGSWKESVLEPVNNDVDLTWNHGATTYDNTYQSDTFPVYYYPLHSTYGHGINLDPITTIFEGTLYTGDIDPRAPNNQKAIVGSPAWSGWIDSVYLDSYTSTSIPHHYDVSATEVPSRRFLFYPTAENLPAFYSISYSTSPPQGDLASRFLYKLELDSDGTSQLVPKVRAIRFEVNIPV